MLVRRIETLEHKMKMVRGLWTKLGRHDAFLMTHLYFSPAFCFQTPHHDTHTHQELLSYHGSSLKLLGQAINLKMGVHLEI